MTRAARRGARIQIGGLRRAQEALGQVRALLIDPRRPVELLGSVVFPEARDQFGTRLPGKHAVVVVSKAALRQQRQHESDEGLQHRPLIAGLRLLADIWANAGQGLLQGAPRLRRVESAQCIVEHEPVGVHDPGEVLTHPVQPLTDHEGVLQVQVGPAGHIRDQGRPHLPRKRQLHHMVVAGRVAEELGPRDARLCQPGDMGGNGLRARPERPAGAGPQQILPAHRRHHVEQGRGLGDVDVDEGLQQVHALRQCLGQLPGILEQCHDR